MTYITHPLILILRLRSVLKGLPGRHSLGDGWLEICTRTPDLQICISLCAPRTGVRAADASHPDNPRARGLRLLTPLVSFEIPALTIRFDHHILLAEENLLNC